MSSSYFLMYSPLVLFAYLTVSDVGIKYLNQNPNAPIPNILKEYMQKGVNGRAQFLGLRADLEVYIGIYLILGWVIGLSNLFSIFFFWQFLRLKYMLNYNTKLAFSKIATTIDGFVNNPNMPGLLKTGWDKVKSLCAYMVQMDQPEAGGQRPSMCTIF